MNDAATIDDCHSEPDHLTVHWSTGEITDYPWRWLRDHSHDPTTLDTATNQRLIHLADLDPRPEPAETSLATDAIRITWRAPHPPSVLPIPFLAEHRDPASATAATAPAPVPWDSTSITDRWPSVDHDVVMASDDGLAMLLVRVATHGFCVVTGAPTTIPATEALVRRIGYVRETIFGGMWDFRPDLSRADTAYTGLELLPHTDGTYSHDAPGLQILHCLAFDGRGGESTMVDGFRIADELRRDHAEHHELLSTVEIPGRYLGDGVDLRAARPVLRHERGDLVQVSFNTADRAPFLLPVAEMERCYDALAAFEALATDPRLQWSRLNPPGEAIVFDNWRVLHGRRSFTGHRHVCGAYVNREDYESRLRSIDLARVPPVDPASTAPAGSPHGSFDAAAPGVYVRSARRRGEEG